MSGKSINGDLVSQIFMCILSLLRSTQITLSSQIAPSVSDRKRHK